MTFPRGSGVVVLKIAVVAAGLAGCPASGKAPRSGPGPATRASPGARPAGTPDDAVAAAMRRLGDPRWEIRRDTVAALGRSADPRALQALLDRLADSHPGVREAAYSALKRLGVPAAQAVARYFIRARGEAQAQAQLLLGVLGPRALPALRAVIPQATPEGRRMLVSFVGRMIEAEALPVLVQALDDPSHRVREAAGEALMRRSDEGEQGLLVKAMHEGSELQRQHLAEVLGVLRGPRLVEALIAGIARETRTVRRHNLLDSLLRHPDGHRHALGVLASPDPALRRGILGALAYEVTSLSRVTHASWVTAERARFQAAFRGLRGSVLPRLRAELSSPNPAAALVAAQVLRFLGALPSVRRQEDAYLGHLEKRIAALDQSAHAAELVVLHARVGHLHWERSCRRPDPLGLCMRSRHVAQRGQPPRHVRDLLHREPKRVRLAERHFRAALAAWDGGRAAARIPSTDPQRARRIGRARHYAAWAKFMEAELALEGFLRQGLPTFSKPAAGEEPLKAARAQLAAWYRERMATARRLEATYRAAMEEVVARVGKRRGGSIYWRLASLSRVGTVYLEFAHQLKEIVAPAWLDRGEDRTSFEEDYLAVVDRFEAQAKAAYRACLGTAARERYFWDLALHCEAEFLTADPEAYLEWAGERRERLTRIPAPSTEKRVPSVEEIRHVVRTRQARVNACFARHPPGGSRAASAAVAVAFRIEVDGRVTVSSITGMGRPDGESCVRQVYEGIRFPVAPPRPTSASYLYHYRPGHQKIAF